MERFTLDGGNASEIASKATDVLKNGGVILYPTDTLYGLGADALSDEAVAKVVAIKGRSGGKPMHAIVADLEMAAEYAEISNDARLLIKEFGGSVTLILKKKTGIDSGIAKNIETFGIRIPNHPLCIEMCRAFGKPITATSANVAGMRPERSVDAILAQLRESSYADVLQKTSIEDIDFVIDGGELLSREPSTVVDLAHEEPVIIREGAVAAADIWEVLSSQD